MTLKDYYDSLRVRQKSPQTIFIETISKRCDVCEGTVRYWIYKNEKPKRERDIRVIEQLTGLTREELWS